MINVYYHSQVHLWAISSSVIWLTHFGLRSKSSISQIYAMLLACLCEPHNADLLF